MASHGKDIEAAVLAVVQGLTLTGIDSAYVAVKNLPKHDEALDTVPCVIIAPAGNESMGVASTEDAAEATYDFEIACVFPYIRDFDSNSEANRSRRQTLKRAFGKDYLSGASTVWRVEILPGPLFDRDELNQSYVYSSVSVRFHSWESRN